MTRDAHDQLQRLRVKMGFISSEQAHLEPIDGRYEVVEEVAMGGMGKVYLVRDLRFETPAALVALKLVASDDPALRDRLWREAHALLSLRKSKHVVPLYDVGRRGEDIYFTMRHVGGGTLRAWQVDKSLAELLDAYLLAARGLADAHACGIVHRDFKPENVLIEGRDVLVADFGLAAAIASPDRADSPITASPTVAPANATVGGTLPYMAPEQLAGEPADARTDQFAFCVALWEACTGCLPWTWKRRADQLEAMQQPPRMQRPLPGWLRRALLRGMALERSARFPDMATLVQQLERGRGRRARVVKIGLGLLGLAAALGLGMRFMYEPPEPCEHFVATIDAHWPSDGERDIDPLLRQRVTELANNWQEHARELCVDGLAPAPTDMARRCMESWLVSLDALLESSPAPDMVMEVVEWLHPPQQDYCDLQRIGLDPALQRSLVRARIESMSGRADAAADALARAQARVAELPDPSAAQAEVDLVRVELAMRAGRDADARMAYEQADASTRGHAEPRTDLLLAWARYLALYGDADELRSAERQFDIAWGRLDEQPRGLSEAVAFETEGQVARGFERFDQAVVAFMNAADRYARLGRPMQALRARQNAGAVRHQQGELSEAQTIYEDILSGVSPSDRSDAVLHTRYELADVLLQRAEAVGELSEVRDECEAALAELERVVEWGRPQLRAEALGRGAHVAGTLHCGSLSHWTARADAALPDVEDGEARLLIERQVAFALLTSEDPRGEPRIVDLLRRDDMRRSGQFEPLFEAWLWWLADFARCDELRVWQADPLTPAHLNSLDCPTPDTDTDTESETETETETTP